MTYADRLEAIGRVISDPTSNLTAAALLVAAGTLIALMLVLALLMATLRPRRADEETDTLEGEEPVPEPRPARTRPAPVRPVSAWLIALLVVGSVASGYILTSTDGFCADVCHSMDPTVVASVSDAHEDIACVRCHEDGLPLGLAGNAISRLGHVVQDLASGTGAYVDTIPSSRCLTCHEDVMDAVVARETSGIRMSHVEPVEQGMTCVECHYGVAHTTQATQASMATCVTCHDAESASSECEVCHEGGDPALALDSSSSRVFGTVVLDPVTDCGGCHDQTACDACHGTRMPHQAAFLDGEHAREAGFEKKEACYRCHTEDDCGFCHSSWEKGHGRNFKEWHSRLHRDAFCTTCHNRGIGVSCEICHPGI
jgi:hypothetical protein